MKPFTSHSTNLENGRRGFKGKITVLIPIFVLAVILGFLLELVTVDKLSIIYIRFIQAHQVPRHFRPIKQIKPVTTVSNSVTSVQPLNSLEGNVTFSKAPLWLDNRLLNVANFQWIRNNPSLCQSSADNLDILPVLVHTARYHFQERKTIRKTWGSVPVYKNWSVRLVFLLGEADRGKGPLRNEKQFNEEEHRLDQEHSEFGDIVTGNFVDSYKNLTYKHIMGYKWILNFCQNAKFVMKIDDDMFIDILQFLDWRTHDYAEEGEKTTTPDLYCNTFVGTKPQRCPGCKWYASEEEWPLDYYPDYCSGWAYGITVDLMKILFSVTDHVDFFWVDDVYATGALMEQVKKEIKGFRLNVKHLWGHVRGLDFRNFRPMCEKNDLTMKRKFGTVVPIARGSNFDRDMGCLWNKIVHDSEYLFSDYHYMDMEIN